MEQIQLIGLSPTEFRGIIRDEVSAKLNQLLRELKPEEVELMNEKSAAMMLRISPKTLKKLTVKGVIPSINIGNGRYRYSRKVLLEQSENILTHKNQRND